MQTYSLHLTLIAFMSSAGAAKAQELPEPGTDEHIVVSATKNPLPSRELGASVIILQRTEIEASGAKNLSQLLQGLPGITLRRNGGAGANSEILIRGDKGGHTLVMIDGVELADSSNIEKNFDIGDLPLYDVERVEIVKGPHSVSYGASGLSGVVHIITRRPQNGTRSAAGLLLGSFETYGLNARVSSQKGAFGLTAAVSGLSSGGYSSTGSRDDGEKDSYSRRDASLRLQWGTAELYHLDIFLKGAKSWAGIDAGANADDPNFTATRQDLTLQVAQKFHWNETFETKLTTSLIQVERKYVDDPDSLTEGHDQTWQRNSYRGIRRSWDLSQTMLVNKNHSLVASGQWIRDTARSKTDASFQSYAFSEEHGDESSYALQHQWGLFDRVFGQYGFRTMNNTEFGKKTVGQAAFNVHVVPDQTILRLNVGRGYKTPSLYQRRSPIYGNALLRPEYVRSEELGVDQNFQSLRLSLIGFQNRTENLIEFDNTDSRYYNVNRALIKGLESRLSWDISDSWNTEAQHTSLSTLDKDSNSPLSSRPEDSWSASVTWKHDGLSWMNAVRGQNRSRPGQYVEGTKGFRVVDSNLSWQLDHWQNNFKVSNLENRWYQEVAGYNTPGRNYQLSSELSF